MTDFRGKTYWLVGASEGLGRAVAEKLSAEGARLILSARSEDRLRELAEALPGEAVAVPIDVGDDASVARAAEAAGEIDGVIFIAGIYWPMKATEWDAGRALAMADVNFLGAFRLLGHVVPAMVARDAGHIVLTGSLSGFRGLPGAIGYGASKAGVMSLAESLEADLRPTGVRVQLINPGFIRTRLTDKNEFEMPFIMDPGPAADLFVRHMRRDRFELNFPFLFSLVFRLSRFLPNGLYYRMFGAKR